MSRQISLKNSERIIFDLRGLYDSYGYSQYRMSKFEEYGLYAGNMDFLVSDGVITFNDTNGKLMALKPDVTLSIVKNTSGAKELKKLYYNENVYRVSKGTRTFKEIMQVGLECIGEIDGYCLCEVLTLAYKSLRCISDNCVLDVSHLGILNCAADVAGVPEEYRNGIFALIGEKNIPELTKKCNELGISEENTELLKKLISEHGSPDKVLPELKKLPGEISESGSFVRFAEIVSALQASGVEVNIDMSVVENIGYYNGIVFKGFVEGVPNSVLSGGQYDTLMKRMKSDKGAVGFAVYTDQLERLYTDDDGYDTDVLIIYGDGDKTEKINAVADEYRKEGERVLVMKAVPENLRYRRLVKIGEGE